MGFANPQIFAVLLPLARVCGWFPRRFRQERKTAALVVVVFRGAREAMASPSAYASPQRENQVGLFGDGAAQPPTPNTNVRMLIAQKEKVRVPSHF